MISVQKPEMMLAYLGSCVGVTLFDAQARIGGMIHILLPEPPSKDIDWNPGASAMVGVPAFIAELCSRGARKERMRACIAGGALMDPVSQADLMLDIGGRTAEATQHILEAERIPVIRTEVGGYFSCCISLDLSTWRTNIEPIIIPDSRPTASDFTCPTPRQINEVIEGLLPIPQIALKILRMVDDDLCSYREVSKEILHDQVLSARIIRMCNSISINPVMKVDSIEKALLRIGEKNLVLLALSLSVENFISRAKHGYSLCKGGIFHHSVWTAGISCKLAEMTGKADPGIAYTAGLLHDIGKVILDQYVCQAYPLFYRQLQIRGSDLTTVEKKLFGMAHTEAGHILASKWSLPTPVTETILSHHEPQKAKGDPTLEHLVYIADLISFRFALGHHIDNMDTSGLRASLGVIDLNAENLSVLLASTPFQTFDIAC